MNNFLRITSAIVVSYLVFGLFVALIGLIFKAWHLIFMLGWNAL